jgi:hypothetical protein
MLSQVSKARPGAPNFVQLSGLEMPLKLGKRRSIVFWTKRGERWQSQLWQVFRRSRISRLT